MSEKAASSSRVQVVLTFRLWVYVRFGLNTVSLLARLIYGNGHVSNSPFCYFLHSFCCAGTSSLRPWTPSSERARGSRYCWLECSANDPYPQSGVRPSVYVWKLRLVRLNWRALFKRSLLLNLLILLFVVVMHWVIQNKLIQQVGVYFDNLIRPNLKISLLCVSWTSQFKLMYNRLFKIIFKIYIYYFILYNLNILNFFVLLL